MNEKIKFYIADAAGNVTLFVTSHVSEQDYARVAGMLLDKEDLGGEQVAFVVDENTMCMCGHEFCGNASRAFALMKAKGLIRGSVQSHNITDEADRVATLCSDPSDISVQNHNYDPSDVSVQNHNYDPSGDLAQNHNAKSDPLTITINTSGAPCPLDVMVVPATDYTKIKMPNPVSFSELSDCPLEAANGSPIVDMDGIVHVIVRSLEPTSENFRIIKDHILKNSSDVPALGVMFVDDKPRTYSDPASGVASVFDDSQTHSQNIPTITMTPVVYVRDVDSTFFEGSCGSGTTALCASLSKNKDDGSYVCRVRQPRGTITCTCNIKDDQVDSIYIEGSVSISEEHEL